MINTLKKESNKMRKLIVLLFGALLLVACGKDNPKEKSDKQNVTTAKPAPVEEESITFENGMLETDKFTLSISKTQIIHSPMEGKPGLFVTFILTNKTKDEDVVPFETIGYLIAEQENDTSRVELFNNYHFLDAFGDDVESYNQMVNLSNAKLNPLLPGKTVEIVDAYTLDNITNDVVFSGINPQTLEQIGKYAVKLK